MSVENEVFGFWVYLEGKPLGIIHIVLQFSHLLKVNIIHLPISHH